MLNRMKIRTKLWVIAILPILALSLVTGISIVSLRDIATNLNEVLYDECYKSSTLMLNADRDMYQALSVFQEIIKTGINSDTKSELVEVFNDNDKQAMERTAEANTILFKNKDRWSKFKHKASGKTVFEDFTAYEQEFKDWVNSARTVMESGQAINDFNNSELNTRFESIRSYLNEAQETLDAAANEEVNLLNRDKDIKIITIIAINIVALAAILFLAIYLMLSILRPLDKTVEIMRRMSQDDISHRLNIHTKDEIGMMANSIDAFADNLNNAIQNIDIAANEVSAGTKQLSDSSVALSQGATEQAGTVEELGATIEEIANQTKLNAENANQASILAEKAKNNAVHGNELMRNMLDAMDAINGSSSSISNVIKVIDEIAFQTNILSLNAAVEAARAGEYGKGFAVVAEEVRNLAKRSAEAANKTSEMIVGSLNSVSNGTKMANETAVALKDIVDEIEKASQLVGKIAVASNEQASDIQQVNKGIVQVSKVIQMNSATAEQSAAASEELSAQAQKLKDQVARFKRSDHAEDQSVDLN